jgi:outer membrane protein assembly factor BamA
MVRRLLLYSATIVSIASAVPCLAQTQPQSNTDACNPNLTTVVISRAYYIDEIRFDGDTQRTKSELKTIAEGLKPDSWMAEDGAVERVAENAKKEWSDRGYFRAEVTATAEPLGHDPTSEHAVVILHVNARRQYRVGEIRLMTSDGKPPVFPFDELRQLIPLQRGEIFQTSKLREGFDNLRKHYGEIGYINFTSEPNFDVNDETGVVNLTLRLEQEKQYRVRDVTIQGLDPKVEAGLRSLMPVGELYNSTKVREFLDSNPNLPERVYSNVSWNAKSDQFFVSINFQGCGEYRNSR